MDRWTRQLNISTQQENRLLSRDKQRRDSSTAHHIDALLQRAQLERVKLGIRKVGITMRSLKRLVGEEVA